MIEIKRHKNNMLGFTLVETLIVLSVFSILAILVTSVIIYSLRGSKKSENTYELREKLDYVVEIVDRQIRNAKEIVVADLETQCETQGSDYVVLGGGQNIDYIDQYGNETSFNCINGVSVASGSATLLTKEDANFTCSFGYRITCAIGIPPTVTFSISATKAGVSGAEGASVSLENQIQLRTY